MITPALAVLAGIALAVVFTIHDRRTRRAEYARLAAIRAGRVAAREATTAPDTRPLKGRRAGAAHPTDAPRTTPGRHVATGRHAAPVTPAPAMVVRTASNRTRSVHTGRMVSAYVASVLALPLPRHCTVPRV